jgi:metallo-beta-lactamase class B
VKRLVFLAALMLCGTQLFAQGGRRVNEKVKPFKLIGNVYYVGMSDMTIYLITTPQGHMLIDTGYDDNVPWIRESIEALGFNVRDVKYILNSHAHTDHVGGHALMKELTGAQVVMSEVDGAVLAAGGARNGGRQAFTPVKPDRLVKENDKVTFGGVTMTAHIFPGHTRGATTWTTVMEENGRKYNVVFWGGMGGIREPFVNNKEWPTIAEEYADTLKRAKTLPCDIYFEPHAEGFGFHEKMRKLLAGEQPNPFYQPAACRQGLETREKEFQAQLAKERGEASKSTLQ